MASLSCNASTASATLKPRIRIAVIGQGAFGAEAYRRLRDDGHIIAGVFTICDSRGQADPLALAAEADGITVRKIERWKALSKEGGHTLSPVLEDYRSVQPDLNVLAFVTQLIPNDVLETPRHGTIVYHPSLNPRKRDASAINWRWSQTFKEGDVKAGFSILFAYDEEGRKTGPTLIARQTDVLPDDDIARLSERFLIPEGVKALSEACHMIDAGDFPKLSTRKWGSKTDLMSLAQGVPLSQVGRSRTRSDSVGSQGASMSRSNSSGSLIRSKSMEAMENIEPLDEQDHQAKRAKFEVPADRATAGPPSPTAPDSHERDTSRAVAPLTVAVSTLRALGTALNEGAFEGDGAASSSSSTSASTSSPSSSGSHSEPHSGASSDSEVHVPLESLSFESIANASNASSSIANGSAMDIETVCGSGSPDGVAHMAIHPAMANAPMAPLAAPNQPPLDAPPLTILHFNDVYNIQQRKKEPVGGASRFSTKIQELRRAAEDDSTLVFFSGDAFSPSSESVVFKGRQMVPALNSFSIDAACFGNHEFDFGLDHLTQELIKDSNFPWLVSNVVDAKTKQPLANGQVSLMLPACGGAWMVGVIGLVESEWLSSMSTMSYSDVVYEDFVTKGRHLARQLRAQGANLIVALTHMRQHNDERLAREVTEIDLVLGGHDHHYEIKSIDHEKPTRANGATSTLMCKSGTDFRELTRIHVRPAVEEVEDEAAAAEGAAEGEAEENREVVALQGAIEMAHKRIEVTSETPEDPALTAQLDVFLEAMDKECDTVLANFTHDLDSTFPTLRTMESNAANFVCDAVRDQTGADIVLINGGTLRSDMVHKAGPFRLRDLLRMLPFPDEVCIIQMSGAQVLEALRNGASSYPRLEGKFLQVSGITYSVDPSEDIDPKQRVALRDVATSDGAPLDPTATFKVCLPEYLQLGKEGFDVFAQSPVLVDGEDLQTLPMMVRQKLTEHGPTHTILDFEQGEGRIQFH